MASLPTWQAAREVTFGLVFTNQPKGTGITNLPDELLLLIFDYLKEDRPRSVCLGLACKKLYAMHRALHGLVLLWPDLGDLHPLTFAEYKELQYLLRDWVGNLIWNHRIHKFCTYKRAKELEIQWEIQQEKRLYERMEILSCGICEGHERFIRKLDDREQKRFIQKLHKKREQEKKREKRERRQDALASLLRYPSKILDIFFPKQSAHAVEKCGESTSPMQSSTSEIVGMAVGVKGRDGYFSVGKSVRTWSPL